MQKSTLRGSQISGVAVGVGGTMVRVDVAETTVDIGWTSIAVDVLVGRL
jgi:hypothetical protein